MDPCTIPDGVGRGGEDGRKGRRVRDTGGEGPEGAQREQVSTTDENEGGMPENCDLGRKRAFRRAPWSP